MNRLFKKTAEDYNRRKTILHERGLSYYLGFRRGYILLIVLVMSAFLVSVTSDFFMRTHIYISYLKRFKGDTNAEYLAYSGFEIAKGILEVDRLGLSGSFLPDLNNNKNVDTLNDIWALELPSIPVMDGDVKITIDDENSKINLSALANEFVEKTPYYGILQRFFINMGLPMDFADAIIDWVDEDDQRFPYGAESSGYYMTLTPPYSAKNGEMDSIDELLMVKGITPEIFYGFGGGNSELEKNLVEHNKGDNTIPLFKLEELNKESAAKKEDSSYKTNLERKIGREKSRRLSDYFRVNGNNADFTDEVNRININTASFRVLSAFSEDMTDEVLSDIIKRRQLRPFTSISETKSFFNSDGKLDKLLTVKSHIFRITVEASVNDGFSRLTAYYDRDNKNTLYWTYEH